MHGTDVLLGLTLVSTASVSLAHSRKHSSAVLATSSE